MDKRLITLGERIAWALEHHPDGKKSQAWLGKELAVSQSAVSEWIRNLSEPKNKDLLAAKLRRSVEWLRTGEGPEEAPPPHMPADFEAMVMVAATLAAEGDDSAKARLLDAIHEWMEQAHKDNQPVDAQGLLRLLKLVKSQIAKEETAKQEGDNARKKR